MSRNRIEARVAPLRDRGQRGIAPYITAGDGGLDCTRGLLEALEAGGAACVELGLPFSDPIADGPVLQAAAQRALDAGTTLDGVLDMVREYRAAGGDLPLALFSYTNPLVHGRGGFERCAGRLADAGLDGVLIPDLPIEEAAPFDAAAAQAGLASIHFVAPTTTPERVARAAEASRGFLYVIGRMGVTGGATQLGGAALETLTRVRAATRLALGVGFGIRNAEQVRALAPHAELAIIGSALVDAIHHAHAACSDAGRAQRAAAECAAEFLNGLKEGL